MLTRWRALLDGLSLAPAQSSNPFSLAATLVWNLTTSMTSADARQNFSRTMLHRSAGLESSGNARKVAYRNPF
jgi:hypothetical protein